jgi:2-iminobutanoate/2-iminopropanoate deaminase
MREAVQTTFAPQPRGHYSQAVRIGSLVFVSGQLPIDKDGNVVKGTMAEEAAQALENIAAILEAAQGSIADIVQCTIYISDISLWGEVNEVYGKFFERAPVLPARAVVPVKDLHYGAHIEIQAIAMID